MLSFNRRKGLFVAALCLCPSLAVAADVPNTFSPGAVIVSAAVNANFAALVTSLNTVEAALNSPAIPDIVDPAAAPTEEYTNAVPVRLPVYRSSPGENGVNEGGASCREGDILLAGGCIARDTSGTELCMVERDYPINASTWFCRARKANGVHSECRANPFAMCLKSN